MTQYTSKLYIYVIFFLKVLEFKVALSGTFTWTCSNLDFALICWLYLNAEVDQGWNLKHHGYFATLLELAANSTVLQELLGLWSDFEHAVPYDVRHTNRVVIKSRGPGISPGYCEHGPRQLEILVTTLHQTHLTFHWPYSLSQP